MTVSLTCPCHAPCYHTRGIELTRAKVIATPCIFRPPSSSKLTIAELLSSEKSVSALSPRMAISEHSLECSHTNSQRPVFSHFGARGQFHSHAGRPQTLRQGCGSGQRSLQLGLLHVAVHRGQLRPGQSVSGQTTAQSGSEQSMLHCIKLGPEHRVSQLGGAHVGLHALSHAELAHFQVHFGTHDIVADFFSSLRSAIPCPRGRGPTSGSQARPAAYANGRNTSAVAFMSASSACRPDLACSASARPMDPPTSQGLYVTVVVVVSVFLALDVVAVVATASDAVVVVVVVVEVLRGRGGAVG